MRSDAYDYEIELDYSMSKVMVWANTTIFQFPKNCFGKNF